MITFNNVCKTYYSADKKKQSRSVIEGLSFTIPQNSVFGLIGSNAMGKTTIIKSILDLIDTDSGEILLLNKNNANKLSRNDVFYLPENFLPPKNLTTKEFLISYLKIVNKLFNMDDVEFYSKMLDIDLKYLHFKISQCSKGTVQKFGLLFAFLTKSKLLILDEPSTGLDVKARNSLKNTIEYFNKNGGCVFLSSHIFSDLEQTCTHFGIFNNGKFAFFGTKQDLLQKQSSLNVDTLENLFLKIVS